MGLAGWRSGGFYLLVERILPVVLLYSNPMYSLKRITHNQEALIGSSRKSLVVVVYLHNANEETSQLSFRHASHLALNCFLFPTHLPITLNICFV